jgi:hypothetical protein
MQRFGSAQPGGARQASHTSSYSPTMRTHGHLKSDPSFAPQFAGILVVYPLADWYARLKTTITCVCANVPPLSLAPHLLISTISTPGTA